MVTTKEHKVLFIVVKWGVIEWGFHYDYLWLV